MERPTLPFPLAVNSSHHSHYHRFLLGADPTLLAPFPKPYCLGQMAASVGGLAENLNLQQWRKLYHASIPWVPGFGPTHYEVGNCPPNRPLPREYCRPVRRFGAFDFVQIADPSVSALALVAGDRRIIEGFTALSDEFCRRVEVGACSRSRGPSGSRATGRMLSGQFAEPNNRWLMPFLHVHSRVLNFTSFRDHPGKLDCIDSQSLARAGQKAKLSWVASQAHLLNDLGYRARATGEPGSSLQVDGVCARLVASIEAPRIAVLRILERSLGGSRPPSVERLQAELPQAVIAALSERLEVLLARSITCYKPAKLEIPSEGPWRSAVREHLGHYCPSALEDLDKAARRAKAAPFESAVFPTPTLDFAHSHAPRIEAFGEANQLPCDPDLGVPTTQERREPSPPEWLAREFDATLREVNETIVRNGPNDPLVSLRRLIPSIDNITEATDFEHLKNADILLGVEMDRRTADTEIEVFGAPSRGRGHHRTLDSLESLFENAEVPRLACEHEMGGRCL